MFSNEEEFLDDASVFMSYTEINFHKKINTIINIVTASTFVFILKLNTIQLAISFILLDIIFSLVNNILIKRSKKILNMSIEKEKERIEKLREENKTIFKEDTNYSRFSDHNVLMENYRKRNLFEIDLLNKNINKIKEEETEKIEKSTTVEVYEEIKNNYIDDINSTIKKINSYNVPKYLSDEISLEEVVIKSKKLKKILKERPEGLDSACITINIYGNELLNILYNMKNISEDQREEFIPKLKEIITEYELHIDRLINKIERNDFIKMNVDMNVLLNEIKKDKGE